MNFLLFFVLILALTLWFAAAIALRMTAASVSQYYSDRGLQELSRNVWLVAGLATPARRVASRTAF